MLTYLPMWHHLSWPITHYQAVPSTAFMQFKYNLEVGLGHRLLLSTDFNIPCSLQEEPHRNTRIWKIHVIVCYVNQFLFNQDCSQAPSWSLGKFYQKTASCNCGTPFGFVRIRHIPWSHARRIHIFRLELMHPERSSVTVSCPNFNLFIACKSPFISYMYISFSLTLPDYDNGLSCLDSDTKLHLHHTSMTTTFPRWQGIWPLRTTLQVLLLHVVLPLLEVPSSCSYKNLLTCTITFLALLWFGNPIDPLSLETQGGTQLNSGLQNYC